MISWLHGVLRRNVILRYGSAIALLLAVCWFAANNLPERAAWLGWLIFVASCLVVIRQAAIDIIGWYDARQEDKRHE